VIQLHSFRTRILLGYGAGILVLAVVFGWAVANLLTLGRASDLILRENYASILAAENMLATLERQDSQLLYVLLGIESTPPAGFDGPLRRFPPVAGPGQGTMSRWPASPGSWPPSRRATSPF